MENALIAILLDFAVFQIKINSKSSVLFHDDEVSVIDGGAALAEKEAAGGDAILMIAMAIGHNAKTLFGNQTRKSVDLDGAIAIAQNGVSGLSRFNCCVYSQHLLSDT